MLQFHIAKGVYILFTLFILWTQIIYIYIYVYIRVCIFRLHSILKFIFDTNKLMHFNSWDNEELV